MQNYQASKMEQYQTYNEMLSNYTLQAKPAVILNKQQIHSGNYKNMTLNQLDLSSLTKQYSIRERATHSVLGSIRDKMGNIQLLEKI